MIAEVAERSRAESLMQARLRLMEFAASQSMEEVLVATLDELEALTGSRIGFYHFVEPDEQTLSLQAWSTRTLRELCSAKGKGRHYDVGEAGVWVDCIRQRRPVIHNDYASLPHKKGLPPGHAAVTRELVVPIFRNDRIVAVLGVGNKPTDYVADDVDVVARFADLAWDIADRKQAEQALRASEARYRMLYETLRDAFVRTDMDGRIVECNEIYCQMLGYSTRELRALTSRELTPERWRAIEERIVREQIIARGYSEVYEKEYRRKDGTIFPVELRTSLATDEEGRPSSMWAIVRDITERKRAEADHARLVTAISQAGEAIVITDPSGTILYVNPAFERTTGYTRAEAIGQNPRVLKSGKQGDAFYRRLWATITAGKTWTGLITNRRKDGTLYDEETTISPVFDETGAIINFVAVKRDVSREQALENQLRQAQKLEAVGQLAAGVAHDFNNLITALYGYAEMGRSVLPEGHQAIAALNGILSVSQQAAGLTKSLLTFSGRSQPAVEPLQVCLLVTETAKLLKRMLSKKIEFQIEIPRDDPLWVRADRVQLGQVLINLALNAHDAMPDGGTLRLSVAKRPPLDGADAAAEASVAIAVADTGIGMTPDVQARIFDPFFTMKSRGRGTGLGLAIVHGIVKEHGGHIEVQSQPGQGSTFTVVLPTIPAVSSESDSEQAAEPLRGHGEPILLVDDDEYVGALLATELERQGYAVVTAEDGDAALRRWRERRGTLRLLVLDYDLPRRNGGECLRVIRDAGDTTPAIIISGAVQVNRLVEGTGAQILHKPFKVAELVELASRTMRGECTATPAP
ncbi:MAG: PAS domain S-box protein [Planctomycetes bacterium]|nr:PAS domain S-box protein [Planctomycetota bacterium]